jgi:hypothetical protein
MAHEMARLTDRPQPESQPPSKAPPPPESPARSPFLTPGPAPQLPPADPRLRQRAMAGLCLAVLSLLAMLLIGNVQRAGAVAGVALAVALAGVALAVSARRAARRAGTRRPGGATAGLVVGLLGTLFSGFALIGFLIFGAQIDQYSNCMHGASGTAAQQACQDQLQHAINARITQLGG